MENLAHSLIGVVLARTGFEKKVPFGTAAIVIAANLPDIDSIATFWGALYYLHHHRGITHSFLGLAVIGFLYAVLRAHVKKCVKDIRRLSPPTPR